MKYYKLMLDDEHSKEEDMVCVSGEFSSSEGFGRYDVFKGKEVTIESPLVFYYDENDGKVPVDYMSNNLGWSLISPAFESIIRKTEQNDLQFIPVIIKERNKGIVIEGYSVMVITSFSDVLDLNNSMYTRETIDATGEEYYLIIKFAFYENKLKDKHVFTIKESPSSIFVSDFIRKEARKNKLTGCDFYQVKLT